MTCYLCNLPIEPQATMNWHHYDLLKSDGGAEVAPTHQQCHVDYHSSNGHFKQWGSVGGKKAAQTLVWAFNLRHVRTHPAYDSHRYEYLKRNGLIGWSAGLVM